MLAAVKRYKGLLSGALARYFPRTTAYLQAEREAQQRQVTPVPVTQGKTRGRAQPGAPAAKRKKPDGGEGPSKAKEKPSARAGVYGPAAMAVAAPQVAAMRAQVARAVTAGVVSPPSEEQWAMILTGSPLTRIFAGAGSGKSTSLVLRVVFMLCHLGLDPARVTVISFTNASCQQLREQLLKVLAFWQFPFDASQAQQCVRTFHSAMGQQAKELLANPVWFEQLDDRRAGELDNPLGGGRLRPAQRRLLEQAYQRCYAEDGDFRQCIHQLLDLPAPAKAEEGEALQAPQGTYKLVGELAALPLVEAFYGQAGFIQSIGIRLDRLDPQALDCAETERLFCQALVPFWACFEAGLAEQGLRTFDGAFQALTEQLTVPGQALPDAALAPLSHLLIDEFQDISPQILQWVQAVQRALAAQRQSVSLMAIGDDWQSIYGWRGSSPELFMDFDRHFPCRGKGHKSAVLLLTTNYRSIEPVVRDGEAVLTGVAFKQAKTCTAVKPLQPGDHGVKLVSGFDLKRDLPHLLEQIRRQCAEARARPGGESTAVLLLSRRNEPLKLIQAQLEPQLPVKAMTIHRAKGLQAEVAIVLDDGLPSEPHPLRNALYAHSGFFRNSYDQAMADESLRLAYVAITRGVRRVFWYTRKVQGATLALAKHTTART
ncbi:MAG: DEAD/DEAH box helicase [Pseudomonas sp.]|uniref:UvrD-helicase domain-containing protein n=1 Tax=Pseudomonas sp. TaxID=306 RepID=UPI00339415F8